MNFKDFFWPVFCLFGVHMKQKFSGLRVRISQYTELNLNTVVQGISIEEAGNRDFVIRIPASPHSDMVFKALATGSECAFFLLNGSGGTALPCVVESYYMDEKSLVLHAVLETVMSNHQ
jgi:hypothetical protein